MTRRVLVLLVLLGWVPPVGAQQPDPRQAQVDQQIAGIKALRDSSPSLSQSAKDDANAAITRLTTMKAKIPPLPCTFQVNPVTGNLAANGGSVAVSVQTQAGCKWTAAVDVGWLMLSVTSGTGNGSVTVSAGANAGDVRTGKATVATVGVALSQAAAPPPPPPPPPPPLPPPPAGGDAASYSQWTPDPKWDTCSKAKHDSYSFVGKDGKRYPTWHPPNDTENGKPCTYGHEHGRNPAGSALLADLVAKYGGVPFGWVNEKLDEFNTANSITNGMRHEDHVGNKIEWENNVRMAESINVSNSPRRYLDMYCDFFMKAHQGTHSKDAFTNNMHEIIYAVQCRDGAGNTIGTKTLAAKMILFGQAGGFLEGSVAGGFKQIQVGTPVPPNSSNGSSGTGRSIPTMKRVIESIFVPPGEWSQFSLGDYEDWISSNYIYRPGQADPVLYFDPHFAVFTPSRGFDQNGEAASWGIKQTPQEIADKLFRMTEVCRGKKTINGVEYKARGGNCDWQGGVLEDYTDPRSQFNGVHREFYFNNTSIQNTGGATKFYTDPFGKGYSLSPFAGSLEQYVAAVDNRKRTEDGHLNPSGRAYPLESNATGSDRNYGGNGVHAPN